MAFNKISRINSTTPIAPIRAVDGPASCGIEFDSGTGYLVLNPDGTRRFAQGFISGVGAPTDGTSGTGAGKSPTDTIYLNTSNGARYRNTGTLASPVWILQASGTEAAVTAGVTPGTVSASKAIVVNASKAVDILRATTERDLGGTGVPGAALVNTEFVKEVTAIADATATTVLTVTVPNSVQAGQIEVGVVGRLGAGGAIGADEAVSSSKYQFTFVRTAGVASVVTASSQLGVVNVAVAGAATLTCVLAMTATGEGVGVANTHLIKATITKSGGSSANHKCDLYVRVFNANASGVTVA